MNSQTLIVACLTEALSKIETGIWAQDWSRILLHFIALVRVNG